MTDTRALIARLEAATGPDRELDAAIAVATTPGMFAEGGFVGFTGEGDMEPPPAYTASIDAALTLVPSTMNATIDTRKPAAATLGGEWVYAATPALAIVIAALRAKGDA